MASLSAKRAAMSSMKAPRVSRSGGTDNPRSESTSTPPPSLARRSPSGPLSERPPAAGSLGRQGDGGLALGHDGLALVRHRVLDLDLVVPGDRVDLLAGHRAVEGGQVAGERRAAVLGVGVHDGAPLAGPVPQVVEDPGPHRGTV